MYVTYKKVSIAKIIREENIVCNQFKHLKKVHSTYLNTLIQDLRETIFVCAVTLIMRLLYSTRKNMCHLMLKLEFIGVLRLKHLYKMLHSLVLDQTFLYKNANNLQ